MRTPSRQRPMTEPTTDVLRLSTPDTPAPYPSGTRHSGRGRLCALWRRVAGVRVRVRPFGLPPRPGVVEVWPHASVPFRVDRAATTSRTPRDSTGREAEHEDAQDQSARGDDQGLQHGHEGSPERLPHADASLINRISPAKASPPPPFHMGPIGVGPDKITFITSGGNASVASPNGNQMRSPE